MRRNFNFDRKYLHWGVTAFCVIAAAILFFLALTYIPLIGSALKSLMNILSPFIWGLALTYLLAPVMRWLQRALFDPLTARIYKNNKKGNDGAKLSRGLSVLFSEIFLVLIISALVYLIIPQLYSSVETIVRNSNTYLAAAKDWIQARLSAYPEVEAYVMNAVGDMNEGIVTWLTGKVLPGLGSMVTNVAGGVFVVFKAVYNIVIGIIVSVYILSKLESFSGKTRRLLYCMFSLENADKIRSVITLTDRTFMSYISGTLVDAALIGMLCYIFCAVVNIPYALLCSVIIGVTNIVPFFGPIIGLVPSALIILMVEPIKCLIFVIFIIVLQQCDGNIIKPKVIGESVGIDGFWVLFSIIIGAGLFGFWGMLLGVPVFSVIYNLLVGKIKKTLRKKDLPEESGDYLAVGRIDPVTKEVTPPADRQKQSAETRRKAEK